MNFYSMTRQGEKRSNNEDHLFVKKYNDNTLLIAIADGMGGHPAGETASLIVTEAFMDLNPYIENMEPHLAELACKADILVQQRSAEDPSLEYMGTTLSVVLVRNKTAYWLHVGDTRIYLFRDGKLRQITEDHTVAQLFVKEGKIIQEEAKQHPLNHVLSNCIGPDEYEADQGSFTINEGDLLMLSTDGLHGVLSNEVMESVLIENGDPEEKAGILVNRTVQAGGQDDITVILADFNSRNHSR